MSGAYEHSVRELLNTVREQNPWREAGEVPPFLAPAMERPLALALPKRLLDDRPRRYQLILGPRRVGKTTVMYQTVRGLLKAGVASNRLWWLRLDHPVLLKNWSLGDLVRAVVRTSQASESSPAYLFLDELVYAKDWDLWLKTFYDEPWPIKVAATSSATAALRERLHESGVGRWQDQYLAPFLFTEYLALSSAMPRFEAEPTLAATITAAMGLADAGGGLAEHRRRYMFVGGFPELLLHANEARSDDQTLLLQSQRVLRSDAVERAIYKDIPQAYGVNRPMLLERLLYVLAEQIGGILSPSSICGDLDGLSVPTFEAYLSYLERAFLVFTLPNYSESERGRQKRGRKLYFVDGAVRNAALQRGLKPLDHPGEQGVLYENLAASHLHAASQQDGVRLYHWRHRDDEVDLIYDHPESPLAFEIASSATHHVRGLTRLCERHPKFRGRCFVVAPEAEPVAPERSGDGIGSLPLDTLLIASGMFAERRLLHRLEPMSG